MAAEQVQAMSTIDYLDCHASGHEQVWLAVRGSAGGSIYTFLDVDEARRLHAALGKALSEADANREKLEEFNSERFHPTGRM